RNPLKIIFDDEKYALFFVNVVSKLVEYERSFDKLKTDLNLNIDSPFNSILNILRRSLNETHKYFGVKKGKLNTYLIRRINAVSKEIKEMDAGTIAIPYKDRIIRVKIDDYNPYDGLTDEKKEEIKKGVEEAANE